MMRKAVLLFICVLLSTPLRSGVWNSVNIDLKTAAAMESAYAIELATESQSLSEIRKMLKSYTSAEVAVAGIFASKWLDRQALKNAGRFGNAEQNYYYKRIYHLVSAKIMPRIFTVALLCIKYPDKALYWGPYLFKVTEDVKALCQHFEAVVCNGRLSFQDILFFEISDQFKDIFDLTTLGDTDWKQVFDDMGNFAENISVDDIMKDIKGLTGQGAGIAGAGGSFVRDSWQSASDAANRCISGKLKDLGKAYKQFSELYATFSDPSTLRATVMERLVTQDSAGVANLLSTGSYDIGRFWSQYYNGGSGTYYKQTWYIQNVNSGHELVYSYTPSEYGKPSDKTKGGEYYYQPGSTMAEDTYEMVRQTSEQWTGWSRDRVAQLNTSQDKYKYEISLNPAVGYWYKGSNKNNIVGYFGAAYIDVWRSWSWKTVAYEETYDSYTQDLNTFMSMMNARLEAINTNQTNATTDSYGNVIEEDSPNPVVYELVAGPKRYYAESDERKLQGCSSVSYTLRCSGMSKLGEGSFSWKENGSHNHRDIREDSKEYAMRSSLSDGKQTVEIDSLIAVEEQKSLDLHTQIDDLSNENVRLLKLISASSIEDAAAYRAQYEENQKRIQELEAEVAPIDEQLRRLRESRQEIIDDYNAEMDSTYRIPALMRELEVAYEIDWADDGSWQGSTFVRHGSIRTLQEGEVTFSASLSCTRGESHPWWAGGIRTHRAILKVDWALTANYESTTVLETLELDMRKSEEENMEIVNARLHELQLEYPACTVELEYAYQTAPETDGDEDEPHLLWMSDRLRIAREVEYRLSRIHAHLILTEKFLRQRDGMLEYLKRSVFCGLPSESRQTFGSRAFRRWRHAARHIAGGGDPENVKFTDEEM